MTPYITNGVSILPTQLSHREGYDTVPGGLAAMPLAQHLAGRHRAREAGVARRPPPGPDLRAVTAQRPPRAPRCRTPAVRPRTARTPCALGGIPRGGLASGRAPDAQARGPGPPAPLPGVRRDRGGGPRPRHSPPPRGQHATPLAPDQPAVRRPALAAARWGPPARAAGVAHLQAIRVEDAAPRRRRQAGLGPVRLGAAEAQAPRPLGEPRPPGPRGSRPPAGEGAVPPTCEGR